MIKASGEREGQPLLILGLSRVNTERLLEGMPIMIDAAEMAAMGLPATHVLVVAGETEADIAGQLGHPMPQPESGETFRSGSPRAPHGRRA